LLFTLTDCSCLFLQVCVVMDVSSFKTGTIIIISQLLENVPSSQCYLSVELISPECLVTSTSRVAVGGMTSGTMITYWIIQLTYRISSDLQLLMITISLRKQHFEAIFEPIPLSVQNCHRIVLYANLPLLSDRCSYNHCRDIRKSLHQQDGQ